VMASESCTACSTSGVVQLLRDAPEFGSLPPHVLRVLAWAYRYSEEAPDRDGVMRAMTALASRGM
jgi:hypothetical protein